MNNKERRLSDDVELSPYECSQRSDSQRSAQPLFPSYFRRERGPPPTSPAPGYNVRGSLTSEPHRNPSIAGRTLDDNGDRVVYAPIAEDKKLGYFSTSALIISKVIGTGVFAKPSTVLANCGGKGVSLGLWFGCGIMSLMGLIVYVELGIALPYSGGDVVYIDEAFPSPKYLAVTIISLLFVFLTHWAANCISFAKLVLQAFDPSNPNPSYHLQKFIALVMVSTVCAIQLMSRRMGIVFNNLLAIYKVTLVVFIIVIGFAAMAGARSKSAINEEIALHGGDGKSGYGLSNLTPAEFAKTEEKSMLEYAQAILGVLWAYTGWENANYVLSEVKRPPGRESRVFKVAAFSSIGVLTTLYLLANIAYFTVLTNEELMQPGEMVAAKFFIKVFGRSWFSERALKVMIALSIFGNFFSCTYSVVRVKQEIAKLRILPFSKFWAKQRNDTPVGGIILHWIVAATVIIAVPNNKNDEAYNLVTDLFTYGQMYMIIFVTLGVVAIYYRPASPNSWTPALFQWKYLFTMIAIYVPLNLFVIVLAWWPAEGERSIPSYVTPGVATGIIALGVGYWIAFAKILPMLGYVVDSRPDELVDGSRVVTYRRYKTGFAKRADEWIEEKIRQRKH